MRRFRGQNRRTKRPHNSIRLPRNAPEIELEIERTGARGDGIGTARYTLNYETRDWPVFVAGTLAGERVRVRPTAATAQGITAEIIELMSAPNVNVVSLRGCGTVVNTVCALMQWALHNGWFLEKTFFRRTSFR